MSFSFRIGRATVCSILKETCQAIWMVLQPFVKAPSSTQEWLEISRQFQQQWNFPHCIGMLLCVL